MITIQQWFRTRAILPLMVLCVLIAFVWLTYLSNQFIELKNKQFSEIEQYANLMQLPITRNDRVILETLTGSYLLNTKATSIAICKDQTPYMTLKWKNDFCSPVSDSNLHRVVSAKVGGLKGYTLVADVPMFQSKNLWLFFLPSTFLVGVCIYIVLTLRKELKENILLPLQNEGKSEKLKIKEVKDLLDKQELAKQSESFKAKYKLAKQVAHDIRSPLSCLEVLAKNRMGQNNNETQLILKSIHRINEIAEDLLQNERTKIQTTNTTLPESIPAIKKSEVLGLKKINLSKLFLESVEFKKIEYSNNKDLKISGFIEPEISDLYFCLDPMIFQRVLSNLINNSVDAIPKTTKGFVSANLSKDEDQILIEIRDNGVGISSENLNTILDHGISLEKKQGNGLGLSHARQVVKDINGKVNIFSKVGMGTTVQICLPLNSSIT